MTMSLRCDHCRQQMGLIATDIGGCDLLDALQARIPA